MPLSLKAQANRDETIQAVDDMIKGNTKRPFNEGPILVSDIPPTSMNNINNNNNNSTGVIMGIDEAGRGPVLGPMVYGAAYWNPAAVVDASSALPQGYNDSKQLDRATRTALFQQTLRHPHIGFVLRTLHATEISQNMLRSNNSSSSYYSLNAMSHDAAMQMVRAVLDAGVVVDTCYVDTVGKPEPYRRKLEQTFPGIRFVVETKADAKYAPCSAASVLAKVARDEILENWKFTEAPSSAEGAPWDLDFGSGYPSDPKCKEWLERTVVQDRVFLFPDLVRFSWAPIRLLQQDPAQSVQIEWQEEEEEDEEGGPVQQQRKAMQAFLMANTTSSQKMKEKKRKKCDYLERRKLRRVSRLTSN